MSESLRLKELDFQIHIFHLSTTQDCDPIDPGAMANTYEGNLADFAAFLV